MTDFHPWQSRPKRHDWRAWIIAIAAVVLLVAAMTLAWGAEGAGNPCAVERANWRRERANALKIGRFYPGRVDTAWALVLQCEDGRRER